jgi:uncharacterized alpha/beta hydrolase family protein
MATDAQIYASILVENLKMANVIVNEDPGTANHANRRLWANYIFANPDAAATKMRIAVMSNGDIQNGDLSDGTVGYVVNVMTNVLANL